MRFEKVRAHPFGPFDHEALTLLPGLNVVYGTNEAGKSTWHAAVRGAVRHAKEKRVGRGAERHDSRRRWRRCSEGGVKVDLTVVSTAGSGESTSAS